MGTPAFRLAHMNVETLLRLQSINSNKPMILHGFVRGLDISTRVPYYKGLGALIRPKRCFTTSAVSTESVLHLCCPIHHIILYERPHLFRTKHAGSEFWCLSASVGYSTIVERVLSKPDVYLAPCPECVVSLIYHMSP